MKHLYLFIFILCSSGSMAQQAIRGFIVDQQNSKPIQYANVFYKNQQSIGTMSMADGNFVLRKPLHAELDTIVISMMGYKTKFIPFSAFQQIPLQIEMNLDAYELAEVSIVSEDALRSLLKKVIENIPKNYPNKKHKLVGYYQEYSTSFDEYKHYLDAYISVENQDYASDHPLKLSAKTGEKYPAAYNKVHLHQLRRSDDKRNFPSHIEKFSDTPINAFLKANVIYEKGLGFLSMNHSLQDMMFDAASIGSEISAIHKVVGLGEQYRGPDTLVTIAMMQFPILKHKESDRIKYFLLQTEWLINKTNYAVERSRTMRSQEYESNLSDDNRKNWEFFKEVQYRNIDGKYYPSMISSDRGFMYMMESQHDFVSRRFIVLETESGDQKYIKRKPKKKVPDFTSLKDMKHKYDPGFWSQFEIPPKLQASEIIKADLTRTTDLETQFKNNQRKIN